MTSTPEIESLLITDWGSPSEMIRSQFGLVTYHRWCELECARMNAGGTHATVLRQNGMVAIAKV